MDAAFSAGEIIESVSVDMDASLTYALSQWQPFLAAGKKALENGQPQEAITQFSEAVRISASFHPVYHFLETGLNTELALLFWQDDDLEGASALLERAIFLHHDNRVALKAKDAILQRSVAASLVYNVLENTREFQGKGEILRLYGKAKAGKDITLYRQTIAICEETHQHYHKLAALPWLWRARTFLAQGEEMLPLVRNDVRRGLDLDRHNPELLLLQADATYPIA